MEILHIENLTFTYPKTKKPAIENIDLSINSGEFTVICGQSGCGKTTLLKLMKKELAPAGEKSGKIFYDGVLQEELPDKKSASEIGYVLQNPDSQIVTDKVWHELAFGLENLGIPTEVIRRRVGEMASYFGIQDWFRKKTDELSGGQKQLLNLASVMVMQPRILILDEPTSRLDPIAATDFISTLQKLNRELGLTVIIAEHRLEEVFPIADKAVVMDSGRIIASGAPREIGDKLSEINKEHPMFCGLPSAVRIYNALGIEDSCPLTVREGRAFLEKHFFNAAESEKAELTEIDKMTTEYEHSETAAIEMKNVWFRYEKDLPDILRGTSLKVYGGEIYCILGGNGAGKTTALNVISGLDKAYRGKIIINGKQIKDYKGNSLYRKLLALLPQEPQTVFIKDSVREDLADMLEILEIPKSEREKKIDEISKKLGITELLDKHPYDLSGGEQQKCAIAKILMSEPRILLLDEPTKGLDAFSKLTLRKLLRGLKQEGMTIIMVTHDVEFSGETADRCALFFDGEILSADIPERFFSENNFYTTAANRMARGLWKYALTCGQVVEKCQNSKGEAT